MLRLIGLAGVIVVSGVFFFSFVSECKSDSTTKAAEKSAKSAAAVWIDDLEKLLDLTTSQKAKLHKRLKEYEKKNVRPANPADLASILISIVDDKQLGILFLVIETGQPAKFLIPRRPLLLSQKDTGKTARVIVGQYIIVQLPCNVFSYRWWKVDKPDDEKIKFDGRMMFFPARGKSTYAIFRAKKPGKTSIKLSFHPMGSKKSTIDVSFPVEIKPAPAPKEITQGDNGKTITVRKGRSVRIRLAGNPTTGYQWTLGKIDGKAVTRLNLSYKQRPAPKKRGICGAGGMYTVTFDAVAAGKTTIRLEYKRSWEKNKKPAKIFTVIIKVVKSGK